MICLSNLSSSINKPIPIVANANLPHKTDSSSSSSSNSNSPEHHNINVPLIPNPNLSSSSSSSSSISATRRNSTLRQRPPIPSVMQIERALGAGSFRDGAPDPPRDSDMKKTVFDLFLGQAMEGSVEKNMRKTGEWLANNTEPKIHSSRKGILIFAFKWMLPIWGISLLIACGVIKLPFSTPFLDDLLM